MKLKEYLEEVGIPVAAFARRVGVSPATIAHFCNFLHEPRLSIALKIELMTQGNVLCKDLVSDESYEKIYNNEKNVKKRKA